MKTIKSNKVYIGIIFILISSLGFALMSVFVNLSGSDIPSIQKVLFRNGVSVIVSAVMILYHKEKFTFGKENHKYLITRSTFGTIGMVLFFYSISQIPNIADANMINKLSSFFLIAFSAIFLKESVKKYQIIAMIVAFIGTVFIIRPTFDSIDISYIAALGASIAAGAAYTILRFLRNRVPYYKIVFYFSTFSVLVLTPFVITRFEPMTMTQVIYLVLAGVFATVGQYGITLAYKYAPASEISIYNYSNVVFASVLAFFVLNQVIEPLSIIGYLIIFGASLYMFLRKKNDQNQLKETE